MIGRLFHGGMPGLAVGDLIEPGHERMAHPGCPWCEARGNGSSYLGIDGPAEDADRVYCTTNRLYAKHYASLWGRGDLYRVEPVGDLVPSTEDTVESFKAPALRIIAIYDRAVELTMTERRRLYREWGEADRERKSDIGGRPGDFTIESEDAHLSPGPSRRTAHRSANHLT